MDMSLPFKLAQCIVLLVYAFTGAYQMWEQYVHYDIFRILGSLRAREFKIVILLKIARMNSVDSDYYFSLSLRFISGFFIYVINSYNQDALIFISVCSLLQSLMFIHQLSKHRSPKISQSISKLFVVFPQTNFHHFTLKFFLY